MITRRNLIRGLGLGAGAALFSPLVRQLRAQGRCSTDFGGEGAPKRFVFFVEGNGLWPRLFHDPKTIAALRAQGAPNFIQHSRHYKNSAPLTTTGAPLSQALSLGALAGGTGVLSLEDRAATVFGLSSKISGGGHTGANGALSCQRKLNGESIDVRLASGLGVKTPFDVMRVGIAESRSARLNYSVCTLSPGIPAPVILDPTEAFNIHFASLAAGASMASFQNRKDLLDFGRESARKSLAQFSGSTSERFKLEHYLTSLETMVNRQCVLEKMSVPGTPLYDAKQMYLASEPTDEGGGLYQSSFVFDRLQAQVDMVTAALLGDLTRVAVVSCAAGQDWNARYPELMVKYGLKANASAHDGFRHVAGNGTDVSNPAVKALTDATSMQVEAMCQIARRLAEVDDVDGSKMLSNTALVYLSDNGEQHHSNAEEWAMLLIGGENMGLRTDGRAIVYPKYSDRTNNRNVSNLFNTLGHAAGLDLNDFGGERDSERPVKGPLSELWAPKG